MRISLAFLILAAAARLSAYAADWPQLQNGPQRLGYSPEKIDVPLKRAWAVGMSPERLHPQAQPVIADGRVFIGTAMGSLHAFEAKTGKKLWAFKAGGPILHTAGVEGGKVFFGCLDGCVYALDAPKGELAWKFESGLRTGFSTAVLLAEGNVFIANRGGVYYALSQKDGKVVWQRDLGVPILMSSACDGGKLFVGAMDMRVYALDAETGEVAWKSETLYGAAFKDYWPVVYRDYVLARPAKVSGVQPVHIAIEWLPGPHAGRRLVSSRQTGRHATGMPHHRVAAAGRTGPHRFKAMTGERSVGRRISGGLPAGVGKRRLEVAVGSRAVRDLDGLPPPRGN